MYLAMFLSFAPSVFAEDKVTALTADDKALSVLDRAEVSVAHIVPACARIDRCPEGFTQVKLTFVLNGCLDSADVRSFAETNEDGSAAEIFVSAYNIRNKRSDSVRCFVAKTVNHSLTLKGQFNKEDIAVTFLKGPSVKLQQGDEALFQAVGRFDGVKSGNALISYRMSCVNKLATTYAVEKTDEKGVYNLRVSTLEVQNELAKRVRCMPVYKTQKIQLPKGAKSVRLQQMGKTEE